MERISINLLPVELKQNKQLEKRKKLIYTSSVIFLAVMIVLTIGLIIFSVILNSQLDHATEKMQAMKTQLSQMSEKEAAVAVLKTRLDVISQIQNKKFSQTDSFLVVTALMPDHVQIQNLTVDQSNKVSLQGTSENEFYLQQFFNNLTDPKVNEGKITKTNIASLSRGPIPRMLFDITINTQNGGKTK